MTTWRQSSYSGETGGECVEVAALPAPSPYETARLLLVHESP
ncbi:DUF397 domain-containing protein [Actinomadura spongiicola]|nr:DUF397 domain-containing protein [Actinomadura spongiicola]